MKMEEIYNLKKKIKQEKRLNFFVAVMLIFLILFIYTALFYIQVYNNMLTNYQAKVEKQVQKYLNQQPIDDYDPRHLRNLNLNYKKLRKEVEDYVNNYEVPDFSQY